MTGLPLATLAQVIAAVGGGSVLTAGLTFARDRRTARAAALVAESTSVAQIDTANVAALQARLVYLEKLCDSLGRHADRLQHDVDEATDREHSLRSRVRELEDEVAQVRRDAVAMQVRCESLERQLKEIT